MSSKLITLQRELANSRLGVDPMFANIPIITEDLQDPETQMQDAVARVGIAVLIATPDASEPFPNIAGVYFNDISVTFLVIENPTYNQTGYRYVEVSEQICKLLMPPYIPATLSTTLKPKSPTIQNVNDKFFRIKRVRFSAMGGTVYDIPQVDPITLTTSPSPIVDHVATTAVAVTLACATAGAAIFYTLDGSNPMPRNGTLYTGAITISAAATLRAKAFLAGYDTSAENRSVYS